MQGFSMSAARRKQAKKTAKSPDFGPRQGLATISPCSKTLVFFGFNASEIGGKHFFPCESGDIRIQRQKRREIASVRSKMACLIPLPPQNAHINIWIHVYPLIYSPLPKSRWLHNMALRYMRSVQLGAYMWRSGLNWFERPKWSKIIFGKTHF